MIRELKNKYAGILKKGGLSQKDMLKGIDIIEQQEIKKILIDMNESLEKIVKSLEEKKAETKKKSKDKK